jgi:hypothetical protein
MTTIDTYDPSKLITIIDLNNAVETNASCADNYLPQYCLDLFAGRERIPISEIFGVDPTPYYCMCLMYNGYPVGFVNWVDLISPCYAKQKISASCPRCGGELAETESMMLFGDRVKVMKCKGCGFCQ